jgi:hypothetical protein
MFGLTSASMSGRQSIFWKGGHRLSVAKGDQ